MDGNLIHHMKNVNLQTNGGKMVDNKRFRKLFNIYTSVVTNATVRIVKFNDLNINDILLIANKAMKIIKINEKDRNIDVVSLYSGKTWVNQYFTFYYIIEDCNLNMEDLCCGV